jgi:HEAT repeat protein
VHRLAAAVTTAVTAASLAAVAGAQAKSPDLARARALLQERAERDVQEGTTLCVKANDVPAVELLLDVLGETERRSRLHLAPGHFRDIVWDGLTRITDLYARRRVEHELQTSRNQHVRQWCAELLGSYGDQSFGDTLRRALQAKDDGVVRQAARALGVLRYDGAKAQLQPLCKHRDDYVRANAIEALARIDAAHVPAFRAAIAGDVSGGVRCALLGAAKDLCPDDLEALCATALRDADWRPRLQAVELLGRVRTKESVDALVGALRDGRPTVAARALRELQELTGQPIQQPDVWARWWADNRATFAFPEKRGVAKRDAGTVAYNGVPVDSDHVAFLIDKSVMMQARLQSKSTPKEEAAHAELQQVLEKLDAKITFNVLLYDVEVRPLFKKATLLTDKSRAKALELAREKSVGKEKDIWQALVAVVEDPTIDTAYLLSSGEPDTGLYVHWNRVTRHLADLNRFHKLTVHSVAYSDNEWFRDQLKKIAETTGGHFQWFQ